jgi:hypothetical protein
MNLALIIHPGHAELNYPLRLNQSFQNRGLSIIRIPFQDGLNRFKNFFNRLMEFYFVWIPVFHVLNNIRHNESPVHLMIEKHASVFSLQTEHLSLFGKLHRWISSPEF